MFMDLEKLILNMSMDLRKCKFDTSKDLSFICLNSRSIRFE